MTKKSAVNKNTDQSKTIEKLRAGIDATDLKIVDLLNRRTRFVLGIGKAKSKENREFYAPERERQIFDRLTKYNKGPFPNTALKSVYREIMSASLSLEKPLKVAFLGPVATFAHQACMQHFGLAGDFIPKKDISDVFDDVSKGRAEFGVVPIENTIEGVVNHTLDLLSTSDLKICAEVVLPVTLALLNKTGKISDIRKICSRPHAIAESKNWIKANVPAALTIDVASTALGAQMAAHDQTIAAIASPAAAKLYGLHIIENHIEDNANNFTNFLVIGKKQMKRTGSDKTSIMFSIKDAPGALFTMLKPFAKRGINLTKIESRPAKTKAWEYVFFVDMDGHETDKRVTDALAELEKDCIFLKVLGSYPRAH